MSETMEIYLRDLTPEAQERVLDFFDEKDESDGNHEICPLFILEVE